jgi:hypothetical protein
MVMATPPPSSRFRSQLVSLQTPDSDTSCDLNGESADLAEENEIIG